MAEIGQEIGAPQEIIDRIAEEQMYHASMYRNLHTVRKHGANAPEEARRIIEASDLEKELRLRHLEKQREVLKRLRNERTIDMNVLHKIQERLDIEEIRVLGPVELE